MSFIVIIKINQRSRSASAVTMLSPSQVVLRKMKSMVKVGCGGVIAFSAIGIWSGNEKFYERILTPLVLNRIDPETSHRLAVFAAKHHLFKSAPPNSPSEGSINLRTRLGTLEFENPIGLAAGFDKSAECMSGLVRMGLGSIEIGSVTPIPQPGNESPRVFRLSADSAVINRYGFNNDGHDAVHSRVAKFKQSYPNFPIGVNLGTNKDSPNRANDYCEGIKLFSDTADYFVINVSSPNTPNLRQLQESENLIELLKSVLQMRDQQNRRVPVFLKLSPDLSDADIKSISKIIKSKAGTAGSRIDGVIISNTTVSRPENLKSEEEVKAQLGGLSGKPLKDISTQLIEKFYQELKGEIPIVGVGGVWSGQDAFEKICAGANCVQVYTVLAYKGPSVVHKVKTELAELLKANDFKSVEEAIGSGHRGRK